MVAIALGFSIPNSAKRHLLHGQSEVFTAAAEDLHSQGLVTQAGGEIRIAPEFEEAVTLRLLGGDTIRVKLWSQDGEIIYSDHADQIGRRFAFNDLALTALAGTPAFGVSDAADPAHATEEDLGELIEYYVPVTDPGGVLALFEVEQRVDTLNTTVNRIRRNTWLSIGVGLGVLTVFMASLTLANAHVLTRRRRLAERLFTELVEAQDAERRRIVGSLHDDVGQPLYRLLYGLQGSRSRLDPDDPVAEELEGLEQLVRDVDGTLRAELRGLHSSLAEDLGLRSALEALAEVTREETEIELSLEMRGDPELGAVSRAALFRAAKEGVTNVRKHAGADHVWVRLHSEPGRVILEIEDDGIGPNGEHGLGLTTMRDRLEAIGGGLRVDQGSRTGTRMRAWVPSEHTR
jgi:signal transduction histidine kinase